MMIPVPALLMEMDVRSPGSPPTRTLLHRTGGGALVGPGANQPSLPALVDSQSFAPRPRPCGR